MTKLQLQPCRDARQLCSNLGMRIRNAAHNLRTVGLSHIGRGQDLLSCNLFLLMLWHSQSTSSPVMLWLW